MNLDQVKLDMTSLDLTNSALAVVCDVSTGRISEILSGLRPPNGDKEKIESAIADMKKLQADYGDLPINFRSALKIKKILEDRKQGPSRELGAIIRELKIPFSVFVRLQFEDVVSPEDCNRALNGNGADPAHTRTLLRLAHSLREFTQSFPEPNWTDVYSIKSVLTRWAAQARERASRQ
jgi:hypothetical protein